MPPKADTLRAALRSRDIERVLTVGERVLNSQHTMSHREKKALQQARRVAPMVQAVRVALAKNDDFAIAMVYHPELLQPFFDLPAPMKARVELAQRRVELWRKLKVAIRCKDEAGIARLYDRDLLAQSSLLDQVTYAYCEVIWARTQAIATLRDALATDSDEVIATCYNPELLDTSTLLPTADRMRARLAIQRIEALQVLHNALKDDTSIEAIAIAYLEVVRCGATVPAGSNWLKLQEARIAIERRNQLREALKHRDEKTIAQLGSIVIKMTPNLLDDAEQVELELLLRYPHLLLA
ncbi:hypothetical protein EYB53_001920 [Candidatus Chloroploca sp. M-50]|uniref:Uncharacterized protein n=1 Tax=Candidatus Chloroploca mongolica TaxID=2528176 RepID=A0ABS4D4T9_9CHLR|nr:hypothetical protein [Candidatus Chloroploca mongolica]MBP1464455.1 hypothetical protein [Candidatus Chloroploca mongolica]